MLATLKLSDSLSQSPRAWRNFLLDIIARDGLQRDRNGDIRVEYINEMLEPYCAHWDDPSVSVVFENEQYKTLWLLKWS
jgi:hypothetical protein